RLIALLEESGDFQSALGHARHAVRAEPLREEAHERLMRLLVAVGQPGAALRQYKEWERLLVEQLSMEPSASLRALARELQERVQEPGATDSADRKSKIENRKSGITLSPSLPGSPSALPSDVPTTANLLLTDLEGSTRFDPRAEGAFQAALETHHRLLRQEFGRHRGQEVKEAGGSFVALFPSPHNALACAVSIQQALNEQAWPEETGPLRVRIALHTGDVEWKDGEVHGPA